MQLGQSVAHGLKSQLVPRQPQNVSRMMVSLGPAQAVSVRSCLQRTQTNTEKHATRDIDTYVFIGNWELI